MKKLWLIIVGAILCVCSPSYAANPVTETKPTKVEVVGEVKIAEPPAKPDPSIVACEPDKDIRTSDLCAQWKAADKARSSAYAAWWAFGTGTALNFLTVVGLWFTYRATKRQLDIAESALSVDARAWLEVECSIQGHMQRSAPYPDIEWGLVKIDSKLINVGRSPATEIDVDIGLQFLTTGTTPDKILQDFCEAERTYPINTDKAVFPGRTWHRPYKEYFVDFKEIEKIEARDGVVVWVPLLVGCVRYKSPHVKHVCETRFVYWLEGADNYGNPENLMPSARSWLDRPLRLGLGRTIVI
jgi:hypothetical protein